MHGPMNVSISSLLHRNLAIASCTVFVCLLHKPLFNKRKSILQLFHSQPVCIRLLYRRCAISNNSCLHSVGLGFEIKQNIRLSWRISCFSRKSPGKCQYKTLNFSSTASFRVPSYSPLPSHPTTRWSRVPASLNKQQINQWFTIIFTVWYGVGSVVQLPWLRQQQSSIERNEHIHPLLFAGLRF
jgi:hypothetical protein